MMMRSVLLALTATVLGATLSSSKPGSLAEQKVREPGQEISAIRSSLNVINGDAQSGMNTIKSDALTLIGEKEPPLAILVSQADQGVARSTTKMQTFKEELSRNSDYIKNDANAGLTKMGEEDVFIDQLGRETIDYLEDNLKAYMLEQKDTSKKNTEEFNDALHESNSENREALYEQKETIQEALEGMLEAFGEVKDMVEETGGEDRDIYDEQMEVKDEIDKNDKDIGKNLNTMKKTNMRQVAKVKKIAKAAKYTLAAQEIKDEKDVEKSVDSLLYESDKEATSIYSEAKAEAQAIDESSADKANEISGERVDIGRDLAVEQSSLRKDDSAANLELTTTMLDSVTELELADDEAESLDKDLDALEEEGEEELKEQNDKASATVLQLKGDLEAEEATTEQGLDTASSQMTNEVMAALRAGQTDVEENVETQIASVQKKVASGTMEISQGIAALTQEADKFGASIVKHNQAILNFKTDMGTNAEELDKRAGEVKLGMNGTKTGAVNGLMSIQEETKNLIEDEKGSIVALGAKSSQGVNDFAASIGNDLTTKIGNLETEADDDLGRSERSIKAAAVRGVDVINGMKVAAQNIEMLKQGIEEHLPGARKSVQESLNNMDSNIQDGTQNLATLKESASAMIKEENERFRNSAAIDLGLSKHKLDKQLLDSGDQIGEVLHGLIDSVDVLKRGAAEDYTESTGYQADIRRQIEAAMKQVTDITDEADSNSVSIGEKLRLAMNTVDQGIRAQEREGDIMGKSAISAYNTAHEAAKATARDKVTAGLEKSRKEVAQFSADTATTLNRDLKRVSSYIKENTDNFHGMAGTVDKLAQKLGVTEQISKGKERAALQKMNNLEKYEQVLAGKTMAAEHAEQQLLEAQKKELQALQSKAIGDMSAMELSRLRELTADQGQKFSEERTREMLLASKTNGVISEMEHNLDAKIEGVEDSVEGSKKNLKTLSKGEAEVAGELNREAGAVGSAMSVGEDLVKRSEQGEEKEMSGAMGHELSMMEDLLGAFGSAKMLASGELVAMDNEFAKDLQSFKGMGSEKAAALTEEVMRLVNSAPDYHALFADDTADVAKEIVMSHIRLDQAQGWTKGVLNGYMEKLGKARTLRETLSTDTHSRTSKLKRTVVTEADKTVDSIAAMRDNMAVTEYKMDQQLQAFKYKLQQLSGASSNHDQGAIDAMQNKLFTLQAQHKRLMKWKDHFKSRTAAWREEVKNQLRKMGRGVGEESDDEGTDRLDSEISMNQAMRSMQMRVEGAVAKANADETRGFSQMADNMGAGVQNVMRGEEASIEEKRALAEAAGNKMHRAQELESDAVHNVLDKQQLLTQNAAKLTKESEVTGNEMGELFKLPQLTTSAYNMETDARIDNYQLKMSRLKTSGETPSSFAEEKAVATLRGSTTAQAGVEQEDEDEIKAVEALNAELSNENAKISAQNERLNGKLDGAKTTLEKLEK